MMRLFLFIATLLLAIPSWALSWKDLWYTPDQQGQQLMSKAQFAQAKETFKRPDWAAAAAYRSGDYQKAADLYKVEKTEQGYYNQGNALAHMGQYEHAIDAYDEALKRNPSNQDALANKQLVKELLKKDQEQKQNQDKQNQDKQNQDQQNQDKQNQDKQNQDKQNQDKQNQDKQNQDKQNQDKQNKAMAKQASKKTEKQGNKKEALSEAEKEKQLAKEQWLRLIPEDPGGLMREKFLRDHLKRERGWYE